jgi:hypothetical protein
LNDQLPLSLIARCGGGRVFEAFKHYIVAGDGYLLLVPIAIVSQDQSIEVTPGCPVPVEEVSALLDEPLAHPRELAQDDPLRHRLSALWPDGWRYDLIPVMPRAWRKVLRAVNENGIRYAEVVR